MFRTVIGLEIHVQLKTKSKMFCGCDNNAQNAKPNTLVCPVCLGLPGVLPVANAQAIEWTLKTGLALNSKLAETSKFDRKHYFYPDLPKNYQISQFDMPFAVGGKLEISNEKLETKTVNLTRIHLEEDAGKLIHADGVSLVDLNRTGTPLMEIVTEPEISSPGEAKIFMQELRSVLRYLSVSNANMEEGHLRCDANISITEIDNSHPDSAVAGEGSPANAGSGTSPEILHRPSAVQNDKIQKLGTPVEIKNLNSFRMVERALKYEEKRQRELLGNPPAGGEKVVKETRGWNDSKGETYSQRSKEFAQDYRYFPEPDIPTFEISAFNIEKIKTEIPELPAAKRKRYVEKLGLSLQDAAFISIDAEMANYFEKITEKINGKLAANWVINEIKMEGILVVKPESLIELLDKIENNEISGKIAKEVLAEMIATGEKPGEIISKKGISQISSEDDLTGIIEEVIKENEKTVLDYKNGKEAALGFLMGMVMRKSKGQANPQIVQKILKDRLTNE